MSYYIISYYIISYYFIFRPQSRSEQETRLAPWPPRWAARRRCPAHRCSGYFAKETTHTTKHRNSSKTKQINNRTSGCLQKSNACPRAEPKQKPKQEAEPRGANVRLRRVGDFERRCFGSRPPWFERLSNRRDRDLKAFEEHIQTKRKQHRQTHIKHCIQIKQRAHSNSRFWTFRCGAVSISAGFRRWTEQRWWPAMAATNLIPAISSRASVLCVAAPHVTDTSIRYAPELF